MKEAAQTTKHEAEGWTEVIGPRSSVFDLRLGELWQHRDLVMMFVRRDFVANYKQTILGPIWFFIQPLLTTVTFVIVFGKIAKLAPDGIPMILFYLAGVTVWSYFSETLTKTATVFKDNAQIFGKVYFPRMTMPFSIIISGLIRFAIQLFLFILLWLWFYGVKGQVHPTAAIALLPLIVADMALLALGMGMIISAMTTKYRDLAFLLTFGIQLAMYATPVIFQLGALSEQWQRVMLLNPMTAIVETFRYGFLGSGFFSFRWLGYSTAASVLILIAGMIIFNQVEKKFTDTV